MIPRIVNHARSNVIAYVALVFSMLALGGGAYAAAMLPPNSVGARQIRNHSIAPIKFNPHAIGGSVLHWAQVGANGTLASSSSRATDNGVPHDGDYLISWGDTFSARCVPVVSVIGTAGLLSPPTGFANARTLTGHPTRVWVSTYTAQGQPSPAAFSLAVLC